MITVSDLIDWAEERRLPCDASLAGDIAIFSPDRRFRFALTRRIHLTAWAEQRTLVASGLNPSKADAFIDDPTIRKGKGFAERWGCGLYIMLNAHGFRATQPNDMHAAAAGGLDVVGEHNDALIAFVLGRLDPGDIALAAWGNHATAARDAEMRRLAAEAGVQWRCFGVNKNGSPTHPLYQRWETPLIDYTRAP